MIPTSFTPPEPFSAIIFDCDGTLVDTARVYHRAYNTVVGRYGVEMPASWYSARLGLSAEALLREYATECRIPLEPADLMEPLAEAYREGLRGAEAPEARPKR